MKIDTLCERLTEYIKVRIITGEFPPGERINELALASQLDVSTASLREALTGLQNEHLIYRTPRKGTRVSGISAEDCDNLWKTREVLECGAVDVLKTRDIRKLPKAASAVELVSPTFFTDLDDDKKREMLQKHNPFPDFHTALVESTDNIYLTQMHRSIQAPLARYQFIAFENVHPNDMPDTMDLIQKGHLRILDLLARGDYEEAKALIRSDISVAYLAVRKTIT